MATTPWVASLYADLFAYKITDTRVTFQQLEDEQTRATLVPASPRMEWDEPLRWQFSRDLRLSVSTLEQDSGLVPILPRPAWDEVEWQHWLGTQYQNQTQEIDAGPLPLIPTRAWDEVDWQRWTDTHFQQATVEQDSGLLPILLSSAFDDWDWSRDFSPLCAKPFDAESIEFARPIVTLLAYDENDSQHRWEWLFAPQTTEQDLPSQPPNPPVAFADAEESRDFTEKHFWLEGDALLGVPLVPSTTWLEENAAAFAGNSGSLAALVMMDEFVNAPSGGNTFGSAPRGRSVRFGFSISAFR